MKICNYDDFISLLKELDELLAEKDMSIDVKAIGGFAMIYWARQYNEKSRSSSRDIDSLSKLPEEAVKCIALVGKKHQIDENWLNNDWLVAKNEKEELEYFAEWKRIETETFKNINLYIIDIETLFFFKMRALDDKISRAEEPPRIQDIRDVYLILKIMDEHDIYCVKNVKMNKCIEYFPQARDFMAGREP